MIGLNRAGTGENRKSDKAIKDHSKDTEVVLQAWGCEGKIGETYYPQLENSYVALRTAPRHH
jgi:hypothetical protein